MPAAPALARSTDRQAPGADAPGSPDGGSADVDSPGEEAGFDPLAETLTPTASDLAAARRLSRPGARREEPRPADPPGYRLRSLIGRGAFGAVWLATESATGKRVAVKTFRHVRALDWPLLTREVEKLAALDASRHVVQLLGVGWEADPPYYVMEYLPDGSLADRLAAGEPLPPAQAAELAEGIAAGLVHAHGSGILHCDLKPGNVLLDRDGAPRLCDFGQSRGVGRGEGDGAAAGADGADPPESGAAHPGGSGTGTGGLALGTLFYMPPEQTLPDAAPDARWDVYALGAVLYELLTGDPPHRTGALSDRLRATPDMASRLVAYRRAVADSPPPSDHHYVRGVDDALAEIVDRCLAPDPNDRYPNAQAVRGALRERTAEAARRSRVRWAVLGPAALAAVLIPVGAALAREAVDASRESVVERALDSNALSARVVARSLEREVRRKRDGINALAANPALPGLLAAAAAEDWDGPAVGTLNEFLNARTEVTPEGEAAADGAAGDTSWFLQDATGITRWRNPHDPEVVGASFVWRDYFHGKAGDLPRNIPPGDVRARPLSETHVSLPYVSTSTDERKLAISTPVRDADGRIVAVLARTVLLDALLAEYDSFKRGISGDEEDDAVRHLGDPDPAADDEEEEDGLVLAEAPAPRFSRVIALYERRTGELLDHPWLTARPDASAVERAAARLRNRERKALQRAAEVGAAGFRTASHVDPVARTAGGGEYAGPWIAAFAPVGGTDWVAVVQEPREAALEPVESLRTVLLRSGAAVVLGVGLALAGLYLWLTRHRPAA